MPFVFIDSFSWDPVNFTILYAASSLAFIVVCEVNQRLLAHFSDARLFMSGLAIQIVLTVGLVLCAMVPPSPAVPMASLWILLMANLGLTLGNATSLSMRLAPKPLTGAASGLLGVAQFSVSALASYFAVLGPRVEISMTVSSLTCALAAGFAAWGALRLRGYQNAKAVDAPPL